jgi:gluconate 2-dehydrogenase
VVLTPHIASATTGTRRAMTMLAADNLIAFWTQGRARTPVYTAQMGGTMAL